MEREWDEAQEKRSERYRRREKSKWWIHMGGKQE